jgi:hypothetical protein
MYKHLPRVWTGVRIAGSTSTLIIKSDHEALIFDDITALIYEDEDVARHVAYATIQIPGVDIDLNPLKNLGFFANSIMRAVDLLNEASQPFVDRELFATTQEQMQPRSRLVQLNGVRLVPQPEG